jgi:hypothetical protein
MTRVADALSVAAMDTRTPVIALSIAAALAVTACGGSSHKTLSAAQYKAKLAALDRQDSTAHKSFDSLPRAKSVGAMRAGLVTFASAQAKLGDEVAALEPPANAAAANTALAKAFHDTGSEMRHVAALLAPAKTTKQALQTIQRVGPTLRSGRELDAALTRLKKLGYTSGD